MMKIVAIVGSLRAQSYNMKLAEFVKKHYADKLDVTVLTLHDIPMYNQDNEEYPPESVVQFKQQVKEADGVLWVTPEYNSSIPGVLGNAIDWLSRVDRVMLHKPSFIMGVSTGKLGTVRAQMHLRDILFAAGLSSPVLHGNDVFIGDAAHKFDEAGNLTDESTIQFLDQVVDKFIGWVQGQ